MANTTPYWDARAGPWSLQLTLLHTLHAYHTGVHRQCGGDRQPAGHGAEGRVRNGQVQRARSTGAVGQGATASMSILPTGQGMRAAGQPTRLAQGACAASASSSLGDYYACWTALFSFLCCPLLPCALPSTLQLSVATSVKELAPGLTVGVSGTVPDTDSGEVGGWPGRAAVAPFPAGTQLAARASLHVCSAAASAAAARLAACHCASGASRHTLALVALLSLWPASLFCHSFLHTHCLLTAPSFLQPQPC